MSGLRQAAGSVAFTVYLFVSVLPYSCWALLSAPFAPRDHSWRVACSWASTVIALLRKLCGLSYRVEGTEHLPQQPAVVLMKHSSAWETIAQLNPVSQAHLGHEKAASLDSVFSAGRWRSSARSPSTERVDAGRWSRCCGKARNAWRKGCGS